MGFIAAGVIGAVGAIGSAVINANTASENRSLINNTQYQPIDLTALQTQAQQDAAENYANSIALEQQYSPGLAASRSELNNQVASNLASNGQLPADVRNQVTRSAITGADSAGFIGAGGPITAAQIGSTSTALNQLYQQNAQQLLANNPLPTSGLDPGALASAAIGQNTAENQFNLSKVGALTNVNQSTANAYGSALGSLAGVANNYATQTQQQNNYNALLAAIGGGTGNASGSFGTGANPFAIATGAYPGDPGCWVAREVFGPTSPMWLRFREWMLHRSPSWFRATYLRFGPQIAAFVRRHSYLKPTIRRWMEARIATFEAV